MNQDRREFLGTALMTIAAAKLGMTEPRSSFGPVKQIDAGLLNVGYAEHGPADGRPVILLHGWPYDIHSYVDVAPLLAAQGYRSIVPYLLGSREANKMPLPPKAELQWWYQFYFATERGRAGYEKNRRDFAKLIWQLASPKWNFDDATFDRSAASFDNPDHVSIV